MIDKFKQILNINLDKYLMSYGSLFIQTIIFLVLWLVPNRIYFCWVVPLISIFCAVFSSNGLVLVQLILFDMLSYSSFPSLNFDAFPITIVIEACFILLGLIVMLGKKIGQQKLIKFRLGAVGASLILFSILGLISSIINYFTYDYSIRQGYNKLGLLIALGICFIVVVYLVMINTINIDSTSYVSKVLYFWNLFILVEILVNYIKINSQSLNENPFVLGWSNSKNVTALGLEVGIPFLALIWNSNKKRIDAIILALISVVTIFLSKSRGAELTIILVIILSVFIVCYKPRQIKQTIKNGSFILIGIFTLVLLMIVCIPQIKEIVSNLLNSLTNLSGREGVWELCIDLFNRSPIIGSSWSSFYQIGDYFAVTGLDNVTPPFFALGHNTFITLLACLGVVGILWFVFFSYETIFSSITFAKKEQILPLITFFIIGLVHGMIDNTFFAPVYLFPYLIIFSQYEMLNSYEYSYIKKNSNQINFKSI